MSMRVMRMRVMSMRVMSLAVATLTFVIPTFVTLFVATKIVILSVAKDLFGFSCRRNTADPSLRSGSQSLMSQLAWPALALGSANPPLFPD